MDLPFIDAVDLFPPGGSALRRQGVQRVAYGAKRIPILIAVAVFRCVRNTDVRLHKGIVQAFQIEALLTDEDIRRDLDHKGDMFRRMKNARDHKGFFLQRIDAGDLAGLHTDLLPDGEPVPFYQLSFYGTLRCRLRQTAFRQHRQGDLLREAEQRYVCRAAVYPHGGICLENAFRILYTGNTTDRLQILIVHQHGGSDLKIPEVPGIKEIQRILFQGRRRICDAEICDRRQHSDQHDGEEGYDLLPDVAARVQ